MGQLNRTVIKFHESYWKKYHNHKVHKVSKSGRCKIEFVIAFHGGEANKIIENRNELIVPTTASQ